MQTAPRLTKETFESEVVGSDQVVMVDFWSDG